MKKLVFLLSLLLVCTITFAQFSSPELDNIGNDIIGVKPLAVTICKGLCGIGACIGIVRVASSNQDQANSIFKWILLVVCGISGFVVLQTIF